MSQEANEILTLLNAADGFVRTQIALYLPFPSVLQASLDAQSRSQILLESVGYGEIVADEGTDELLRRAAVTDEQPARAAPSRPLQPEIMPESLFADEPDDEEATEGPPTEEKERFPPGFDPAEDERVPTTPIARAMKAALEPVPELPEDTSDPVTFGDPDETEDLLRDGPRGERTVADALGLGDLGDDDDNTDPGAPTEVDDAGQDALVTIEDTSDPRSDLEGLSELDDSDIDIEIDDDSADSEVVVRKPDALDVLDEQLETFDLMPDEDDLAPDEEETFVADLADIERMKSKMAPDPEPEPPAVSVGGPRVAAAAPRMKPPPEPRVAGVAAVSAGGQSVTAGLYGNPSVPTIRDRNAPRPAAAAIQIDDAQAAATGGGPGGGSLLEEDELLELGASEDYGEEEYDGDGDGLSLDVQEYGEDEEEEEELEEIDDIELEEIEPDDVPLEPIDHGPTPAELAAMVQKAKAAINDGDMEAGINFYSDVLDADPDNVDAYVARGRLYLDYGDYSRAMSDFMHAETLQPDNPEPQVAVGDLHFARKDYNRAIDFFNEALKMSPNHAMAYCRRGISHYYRKHYQQALDDLNKAQKLDDDIPNIRTYIAMAKKKVKK
ncbi:MAG: tetratricopeptide repeat protein [Alphaproteobacteria bacterium]|nr:tetratricopeptide repeat protein [Alphaproteobacteria bacterium]